VAEAGGEFVGKLVAGSAHAGAERVAALHDEAGNDAMEREAVEVRFAGFGTERAFGEADEIGDGERGFFEEEFGDDRAARRGEFGVETVGEIGGGGLGEEGEAEEGNGGEEDDEVARGKGRTEHERECGEVAGGGEGGEAQRGARKSRGRRERRRRWCGAWLC
jgi:hypothetical protein